MGCLTVWSCLFAGSCLLAPTRHPPSAGAMRRRFATSAARCRHHCLRHCLRPPPCALVARGRAQAGPQAYCPPALFSYQSRRLLSSRVAGSGPTIDSALTDLRGILRTFMLSVHPDLLHGAEAKIRRTNETSLMVSCAMQNKSSVLLQMHAM